MASTWNSVLEVRKKMLDVLQHAGSVQAFIEANKTNLSVVGKYESNPQYVWKVKLVVPTMLKFNELLGKCDIEGYLSFIDFVSSNTNTIELMVDEKIRKLLVELVNWNLGNKKYPERITDFKELLALYTEALESEDEALIYLHVYIGYVYAKMCVLQNRSNVMQKKSISIPLPSSARHTTSP